MIKTGSDFSGVGAFDQALIRLGINYKTIFACDMDKYARQTYIENYGEPGYFPKDVYNRDIPKIEGFGIESRVAEYNPETQFQCLLTRKDTDFTSFQEAYPFKDLGDLFGLTRFVDAQIGPIELDEEKEVELLLHGSVKEFIGYGE